jgi:hypothetical protein
MDRRSSVLDAAASLAHVTAITESSDKVTATPQTVQERSCRVNTCALLLLGQPGLSDVSICIYLDLYRSSELRVANLRREAASLSMLNHR